MATRRILVLSPGPDECGRCSPERIENLLRHCLPSGDTRIEICRRIPPGGDRRGADLLIFRSARGRDLEGTVRRVRSTWRSAPILGLFCGRPAAPRTVLQSLIDGLDDYLCCPLRELDVAPRVEWLLRGAGERPATAASGAGRPDDSLAALVGQSRAFLRVVELVPRLAHTDATVLVTGETGTGKELVARAIHYCSTRRGKPFVPLNCGALPEQLVENELFGHARGAFTDASSKVEGLVAEAHGGTLLLDEVETLSQAAQAKLLRFLQDREYRPLGTGRTRTADVRIVAATNVNLGHKVARGEFREDFFYRLNILSLSLPPLRDRRSDVPLLANHFLRRYERQFSRRELRLDAGAMRKLSAHHWPGNVRELEAVIQRALLLSTSDVLGAHDLSLPGDGREGGQRLSFSDAKKRVIERFERSYLTSAMAAHNGNVTWAARSAGTERRAFQRLLRKHGVDRLSFRD